MNRRSGAAVPCGQAEIVGGTTENGGNPIPRPKQTRCGYPFADSLSLIQTRGGARACRGELPPCNTLERGGFSVCGDGSGPVSSSGRPLLDRERHLITLFNSFARVGLRIAHRCLDAIPLQFRTFFESGICSQTESTGPPVEFAAARHLVFRETLQQKLPSFVAARASACGEVAVPVKKCIAVSFCKTDLFDHDVAVVGFHALLSPFYRRAAHASITVLACFEEVFPSASRMPEKLVGKRPGFATNMTFPSGQVCFACIQLRTPNPQDSEACCLFIRSPGLLSETLPPPVGFESHILAFCLLQPVCTKVIENTLVVHGRPLLHRSFLIPSVPYVG